jgi:hypothetical protein
MPSYVSWGSFSGAYSNPRLSRLLTKARRWFWRTESLIDNDFENQTLKDEYNEKKVEIIIIGHSKAPI